MLRARKTAFLFLFIVLVCMAAFAHAEDRTQDFQLIDTVVLTNRDGEQLPDMIPRGQEFKLNYEFSIPNDLVPELSEGDTYVLSVPMEIPLVKQSAKPLMMGDVKLAEWEILKGNLILVTFTEYASKLSERGGDFWINAGFDTSTIGAGGETTLDFDLGFSENLPITVEFDKPVVIPSVEKRSKYLPDTNQIEWSILVRPGGTKMSNFVIRDMIPQHTAFVDGSVRYDYGYTLPTFVTYELNGSLLEIRLDFEVASSFTVLFKTTVLPSAFEGLGPADVRWIENQAIVGFSEGSTHTNVAKESVSIGYAHKTAEHNSTNKTITWTVVVNPQGYDLKNVTFQDTLPVGTAYIVGSMNPAPPASFKVEGQTISFTPDELNAPMKFTYKTLVSDDLYLGGSHTLNNHVLIGHEGARPAILKPLQALR